MIECSSSTALHWSSGTSQAFRCGTQRPPRFFKSSREDQVSPVMMNVRTMMDCWEGSRGMGRQRKATAPLWSVPPEAELDLSARTEREVLDVIMRLVG